VIFLNKTSRSRHLYFKRRIKIVGVEDGSYFLQSRSINDMGLEGPSLEPAEIIVRVNPLPPFIQSPSDGADLREKTAQFQWLKVDKAVRCHLQVAEDRKFQVIVADAKDMRVIFPSRNLLK